MAELPGTLEGWYALHDLRRFDWAGWRSLSSEEQKEIVAEAAGFFRRAEQVAERAEGSSALYAMLGHKADLMLLHLRPTVDELGDLERAFARTRLADFTEPTYSYVSVTELSLYEAQARGGSSDPEELRSKPFVQQRLKPIIPDRPYVCFYPMSKRRGEQVNWYTASYEERREMMREHATTGRKYHDQITQMITGSTGLDDWEWGVTLFATDALAVKKLVYEMRFDLVTARYAEFGPFHLGTKVATGDLGDLLLP